MKSERVLFLIAAVILIAGGLISSGFFGFNWSAVDKYLHLSQPSSSTVASQPVKIVSEESVIIDVVKKATPSVVTVSIIQAPQTGKTFQFNPFNSFSPPFDFGQGSGGGGNQGSQNQPQDIGSGFIVTSDGLIITNKHVVSDAGSKYKVVTADNKTYDVVKIYRDPANDLAVLKINAGGLSTVEMGDSGKIQVGQLAIAIGTALGQFRSTVTTGVISGLGRGISAGSPFEGSVEQLDNVIQTSAAISPGNSGGPLLNSGGQVVGVNAAVARDGQNIGFAIPINVIKDALKNFNSTGAFNRPYLGIRFKTVTKDLAVMNNIPEGTYVSEVVAASPAEKVGIQQGDIIINIDNTRLSGTNNDLAKIVSGKKVGDRLDITVNRDGKNLSFKIALGNQSDQ